MATTVEISGASIDLTRVIANCKLVVNGFAIDECEASRSRLKLTFGNFELRDFKVTLHDGRIIIVPRLFVDAIIIKGDMLPVSSEDGETVKVFDIIENKVVQP